MPQFELSRQLFQAVVALIKLMISGDLEENHYYMAKNRIPKLTAYCTISGFPCQSGHSINDFSFSLLFIYVFLLSGGKFGVVTVIGTLQLFKEEIA